MGTTVRYGVFETNSSSTHSLSIPNKWKEVSKQQIHTKPEGNMITFSGNTFEWEWKKIILPDDKIQYLYTLTQYLPECEEYQQNLAIVIEEETGYKVCFQPLDDDCYIDHGAYGGSGGIESIEEIFHDKDILRRLIFSSNGYIVTGNDNDIPAIQYAGILHPYLVNPYEEVLYKYQNGDYDCSIYKNGTLIRKSVIDDPQILFPCSVDMKITDFCTQECKFCYQSSSPAGKEANINDIMRGLDGLPAGVEVAIGGGDALSYPWLQMVLEDLKEAGLVSNLTIHQAQIHKNKDRLVEYLTNKLIHGLGISISQLTNRGDIGLLLPHTNNIVYHIVVGYHNIDMIADLTDFDKNAKILILGYKNIGRGADYAEAYSTQVQRTIQEWKDKISDKIGKYNLSFDNRALQQLEMQEKISDEDWGRLFMGEDGKFSIYYDAVNRYFARNSFVSKHEKKYCIDDYSIFTAFNAIKDRICIR